MSVKKAFPAITSSSARVLILGTMPSEESLARQEYYGNPRNQFWRIMQELYDAPLDAPYEARVRALQQNGVALWDVLESCERAGSLDSAIKNAVPNDFSTLFNGLPELKIIAFNGKKAAEWFTRWARVDISHYQRFTLPSTSPAASMPFEKKLAAWSAIRRPV